MSEEYTLETLSEKFGRTEREDTHEKFDARASGRRLTRRLSRTPNMMSDKDMNSVHAALDQIQYDLAELAEDYGKLNVQYSTLIGSGKIFGWFEGMKIKLYDLIGRKKVAREMRLDAGSRRRETIDELVDKMAEILNDQHANAKDATFKSKEMLEETIAHMRHLDTKLVGCLRSSYVEDANFAEKRDEVNKLTSELEYIQRTLDNYRSKVEDAKINGDLESVRKYTGEMTKVLDFKSDVLEGKRSAEGYISDVRRQVLDATEGIQSAQSASAAAMLNYQLISSLIDSMSELEIKYRHAKEDFMPLFKTQAKIAMHASQMEAATEYLHKVSNISHRIMATNAKMIQAQSQKVFELLKKPMYDSSEVEAVLEDMYAFQELLNEQKDEWASLMREIPTSSESHYAMHR